MPLLFNPDSTAYFKKFLRKCRTIIELFLIYRLQTQLGLFNPKPRLTCLAIVRRLLGNIRLNKKTFRYLLALDDLSASVQPSFVRKLADQGRRIDSPCLINLTNADLLLVHCGNWSGNLGLRFCLLC